jgi:hypothetical protein
LDRILVRVRENDPYQPFCVRAFHRSCGGV